MTMPTARFRVTIRSYEFLTAEVSAQPGITEENLREILFGMVERGELVWETDYAETLVTKLEPEIADEHDPNFPPGVDSDAGSE